MQLSCRNPASEHNKEKVVGHIISSSFSDIKTNELLGAEQLRGTTAPFNIALGALVYKVVNPAFARMLEQTDEGDQFHNMISQFQNLFSQPKPNFRAR